MIDEVLSHIEAHHGENAHVHPYFEFEPWNIEESYEDWKVELAREFGIDFKSPEVVARIGDAPREFQSGYMMSDAFIRVMFAGNQTGKALPMDAVVYTPSGAVLNKDLSVGDEVLGPTGDTRIVDAIYKQGVRPVYQLTFDDDSTCECDIDHLWKILPPKHRWKKRWSHGKKEDNPLYDKWEEKTLSEIIGLYGEGEIKPSRRPCIPMARGINFNSSKPLDLSPYVMGAILGDGGVSSDSPSMTIHDKDIEIIDRMREEMPANAGIVKRKQKYAFGLCGINPALRKLGLLNIKSDVKFVPEEYKYRSFGDRLALLQGLMDTDGSVSRNGIDVEFSSKSRMLAEDVQWLVESLGGKAKLTARNTSYKIGKTKIDCGVGYRLRITLSLNPFFLERKRKRLKHTSRTQLRILKRIDYVRDDETQCIKLNHEDGLFMTDHFIVTHNTYGVLAEAVMRLSGEIPLAMRYPKGVNTNKKRSVTENNIKRFGRRDAISGEFLDKKAHAEKSLTWDCGLIEGAGVYPKRKIHPPGSKIWVVTKKQARDDAWWPTLKGMIPDSLLDKTKGSQQSPGFDERSHTVHLTRGCVIKILTYEQGYQALEAAGETQEFQKLVQVVFDEEPPSDRFLNVVLQRVSSISLITTPYEGLSWTFDELWVKALDNPDIEIFHCTQYDCPYKTKEEVDKRLRATKKWEVASRIFGMHSDQSGRPYFEESYEVLSTKLRSARESFTKERITASFVWENGLELASRREEVEFLQGDGRDSWEIYEHPDPKHTYWMSVDTAEGSDDEKQEQDRHAAHIMRLPMINEGEWPVQVATLDTGLECDQFARLCMYGCAAYNNALLAPESLGKSAGIFLMITQSWPFRYTMVVTNDITKKQTEKYGFFTSSANRTLLFDLVGTMMKDNAHLPMFGLRNLKTLKQIAGTIVGKGGRPDHKKRKRNDCLMSYGIGLYIFKEAREQIVNRVDEFTREAKPVDPRFKRREANIYLCRKS